MYWILVWNGKTSQPNEKCKLTYSYIKGNSDKLKITFWNSIQNMIETKFKTQISEQYDNYRAANDPKVLKSVAALSDTRLMLGK